MSYNNADYTPFTLLFGTSLEPHFSKLILHASSIFYIISFHLNFWPTNVQTSCADLRKLEFKSNQKFTKRCGHSHTMFDFCDSCNPYFISSPPPKKKVYSLFQNYIWKHVCQLCLHSPSVIM